MAKKENRYTMIIEHIFFQKYEPGQSEVPFSRDDIVRAAQDLDIKLPKNLGDVIYSFRYRSELPETILREAPEGQRWVIKPAGKAQYRFSLSEVSHITPRPKLSKTKIPNATPGIIDRYALSDEQALLAKLRYNRLVDVFTGLTCYPLQSHMRTYVEGVGQVETDEIYVGVDKHGAHYVIPVQAKGSSERLGIVQIEQDFAVCRAKFPALVPLPVAAQFLSDEVIALFSFEQTDQGIAITSEKHYALVPPEDLSEEEIERYRQRAQLITS